MHPPTHPARPGRSRRARLVGGLALSGALAPAAAALAQEAMYTAAATMPSPGTVILREQYIFERYGLNPVIGARATDRHLVKNTVAIGLDRGLSFYLDAPVETRVESRPDGTDDTDTLVPDVDLMLKWRFYQSDPGGVDTARAALLGGVRLDTEGEFAANPHLGIVYTQVWGRHGFNQELHYTLNTNGTSAKADNFGGEGPADAFAHNTAYLYRLWPERYAADTEGAWYATAEINGIYETTGDYELKFSPGIMYEGKTFGLELMAQLPIYQAVHDRPELDWSVGVGLRILF